MNTNNEQTFNVSSGCIRRNFYENYIKDDITEKTQEKFEALLVDEEDDVVDYYRVKINNPDDMSCEFSTLWFFDLNLGSGWCIPVFKSGVNTSSYLAMELCGLDRDEEDVMTLDELIDFAPNGNQKSRETIKRILLLKK